MSDSVRPHRQQPTRLRSPWDSPGKNTGVGCHFLLDQGKYLSMYFYFSYTFLSSTIPIVSRVNKCTTAILKLKLFKVPLSHTVLDLSSLTEDTRLFIIGTISIVTDSSLAIPCLVMNTTTALKHSVYHTSNFAYACMHAKSFQLCPTLCNSMDCSLSGSSVHGTLQARILGFHALLQGIFPIQGSNPCLFCSCTGRQVLYH